jgi:quinol monooxygenase YgiN
MTELNKNTSTIDMLFSYRIKPGMEARYQDYLEKVVPVTEAQEPYVLEYEIYQAEDGTYFQHERYEDEGALWRHLEVTAEGQESFNAAAELQSFTALGQLSQKFWDAYGALGGTWYKRFRQVAR